MQNELEVAMDQTRLGEGSNGKGAKELALAEALKVAIKEIVESCAN